MNLPVTCGSTGVERHARGVCITASPREMWLVYVGFGDGVMDVTSQTQRACRRVRRALSSDAMRHLLSLILLAFAATAAAGEPWPAVNRAVALFEAARPGLPSTLHGVDREQYRAALTQGQGVNLVTGSDPANRCERFAAYALLPAQNGVVRLVFCPRFFSDGSDELRALTVLHEMVHVVAGPDECRAMAFAAAVEQRANGRYTPVDAYWRANGCEGSGFTLPR